MAGAVGVVEAEAFEAGGAEMLEPARRGPCRCENAQAGRRVSIMPLGQSVPARQLRVFAHQAFGRGDAGQFVGQSRRRESRRPESGRSKARPRPGPPDRRRHDGGQIVARARIEQGVVGDGAGA